MGFWCLWVLYLLSVYIIYDVWLVEFVDVGFVDIKGGLYVMCFFLKVYIIVVFLVIVVLVCRLRLDYFGILRDCFCKYYLLFGFKFL